MIESFTLPDILKTLDLVIFRYDSQSQISQVHDLPHWFPIPASSTVETITPHEVLSQSHFLQNFLKEANQFWLSHKLGGLPSGLWTEPFLFGEGVYLEATALNQHSHRLLIIQRFPSEPFLQQRVFQSAREEQLDHRNIILGHQRTESRLGNELKRSQKVRDDVMTVLDELHLGAIFLDDRDVITFASRKAQEFLGQDEMALLGRGWAEVIPEKNEQAGSIEGRPAYSNRDGNLWTFSRQHRKKYSMTIQVEEQVDPRNTGHAIILLKDVTEVEILRRQLTGETHFQQLIGKSQKMKQIYERIGEIAPVDVPVLIEGETGTGKELVAQALHNLSSRKSQPFVAVNCAGLTDSLLGSQLFGHKRGAFTGAVADHEGYFEAADGGTLFLDEIGDMPISIQTTMLRVLQEGEVLRLGESRPRKVNVRILAATNQHLPDLVKKGTFRSDLLYRIRVARLHLPPLRERKEDFPLLCRSFLGQARAVTKKFHVQDIGQNVMQKFLEYDWPGNVREMKSAIDYAVIHCHGPDLQVVDLPTEIAEPELLPSRSEDSMRKGLDRMLVALEQADGKRAQAAKLLGMSRSTFYRRLKKLGLD